MIIIILEDTALAFSNFDLEDSTNMLRVMLLLISPHTAAAAKACAGPLDCSLNGECSPAGVCVCDTPWSGSVCGVLSYKTTPKSGKSLYPESDPHNTWNGAIIQGTDGVYHLYNPLYPAGSLGGTTTLMFVIMSIHFWCHYSFPPS